MKIIAFMENIDHDKDIKGFSFSTGIDFSFYANIINQISSRYL